MGAFRNNARGDVPAMSPSLQCRASLGTYEYHRIASLDLGASREREICGRWSCGVPGASGQAAGQVSLRSDGQPSLRSDGQPSLRSNGQPSLRSNGQSSLRSNGQSSLRSDGQAAFGVPAKR